MAFRFLPCRPAVAAMKCPMPGILCAASVEQQQVRGMKANKHQNPKYKNLRRLKVDIRFPLKYHDNLYKAMVDGVSQNIPSLKRMWKERDFYLSCTNQIVDEYVPEESKEGYDHSNAKTILKDAWGKVEKLPKNKIALRKIRGFEGEFNLKVFADEAKEVYIKAHECLAANDQEKLNDCVTEHARLAMLLNSSLRTIHWKFLQSLEEPRVVQIRTFQLDENSSSTFAQITVRMFSQQTLAVYDRFGRLMYGSEILAKDVLEYVIFEKHLSNEYGVWRLHAKIIPPSLIKMGERTFVAPQKKETPQEVKPAPVEDVTQDTIQA